MKSVTIRLEEDYQVEMLEAVMEDQGFSVSSKAVVFMIEQHRFQKNLIHDLEIEIAALKEWSSEQSIVIAHLRYLDK